MTRSHFSRLAGGGLLLVPAIQLFLISRLYVWMAIPYFNLQPVLVIAAVALVVGLLGLGAIRAGDPGWLGRAGFVIALAGTISSLIEAITGWTGFSILALFIGSWLPHSPPLHNGLASLQYPHQVGIWLTRLCLCVGPLLYGLAMFRVRRVARRAAAALIAIGLLQLPFAVLFALMTMLAALLWGPVGFALLLAPRAADASTPLPRSQPA